MIAPWTNSTHCRRIWHYSDDDDDNPLKIPLDRQGLRCCLRTRNINFADGKFGANYEACEFKKRSPFKLRERLKQLWPKFVSWLATLEPKSELSRNVFPIGGKSKTDRNDSMNYPPPHVSCISCPTLRSFFKACALSQRGGGGIRGQTIGPLSPSSRRDSSV